MLRNLLINMFMAGLILTGSFPSAGSTTAADPMVLARVQFQSQAELNWLGSRMDIWEVHAAEGYVLAYMNAAGMETLRQAGYTVTVDWLETASAARLAAAVTAEAEALTGIPGYSCYRTVAETEAALAGLAAAYPNLTRLVDIGDSWERVHTGGASGHDLWALEITNHQTAGGKPVLFVMGAIHAREYATAETALRFAEFLLQQYGNDANITWLLDHNQVSILPQANPDGRVIAEDGYYQRKNANLTSTKCSYPPTEASQKGVDLNRNSSFEWGGDSDQPCNITYQGPSAASEPETQAIQTYAATLFADRRGPNLNDAAPEDTTGVFITLHSYGGDVLWPWGHTSSPAPNSTGLQVLGRKMAYLSAYSANQSSVGMYYTTGATDDWAYGELGMPAYTIEMGTDFFEPCENFEETVYGANRSMLWYALKSAARPYVTPFGPEVYELDLGAPDASGNVTLQAAASTSRTRPVQTLPPIQSMVFWVDGQTASQTLLPQDGAFGGQTEIATATLSTQALPPGRLILLVAATSTAGVQGAPAAIFLDNTNYMVSAGTGETKITIPGMAATHSVTVTNQGNMADTYDVTVDVLAGWTADPVSQSLTLAAGTTGTVNVALTPPGDAMPTTITMALAVQSQTRPLVAAGVDLTTQVMAPYAVQALTLESRRVGQPGDWVTHSLAFVNTGFYADDFTLTLSGAEGWETSLSTSSIHLLPGELGLAGASLHLPDPAPTGGGTATLTVQSQTDPLQKVEIHLISLPGWELLLPILVQGSQP